MSSEPSQAEHSEGRVMADKSIEPYGPDGTMMSLYEKERKAR